ncbi:MAG: hypothetical protein H6Q05_3582, partial [Acidobacteria bacterium]|nr:hypothetical protein [Acidobacteriota bacterium]
MTANHASPNCSKRLKPVLLMLAVIHVIFIQIAWSGPQQGGAKPIVTDQTALSLSDKFFAQTPLGMKANGDVFFGSGAVDLFHWSAASGVKTRLLQVNDPIPGFPGSVARSVAAPMQVNAAGHVALINTWAAEGVKNPAGVFVYDGSQYLKVALSGEAAPGVPGGVFTSFKDLRVNANDQVA